MSIEIGANYQYLFCVWKSTCPRYLDRHVRNPNASALVGVILQRVEILKVGATVHEQIAHAVAFMIQVCPYRAEGLPGIT